MKKYLFFLALIFASCSTDDDALDPEQETIPPTLPVNITYEINFPDVTFYWDESIAPEGGEVTYELFLTQYQVIGDIGNSLFLNYYFQQDGIMTTDLSYTFTDKDVDLTGNAYPGYVFGIRALDSSGNETEIVEVEKIIILPTGTYEGDIILRDQLYVDAFENHEIQTINGNLVIGDVQFISWFNMPLNRIRSISPLKGLKKINGDLIIGDYTEDGENINLVLGSFHGLHDIEEVTGKLIIEETSVQDLDDFESLTTIGGKLEVFQNVKLEDFCKLSNFFISNDFEIYQNLYNPTLTDFMNGDCSN